MHVLSSWDIMVAHVVFCQNLCLWLFSGQKKCFATIMMVEDTGEFSWLSWQIWGMSQRMVLVKITSGSLWERAWPPSEKKQRLRSKHRLPPRQNGRFCGFDPWEVDNRAWGGQKMMRRWSNELLAAGRSLDNISPPTLVIRSGVKIIKPINKHC